MILFICPALMRPIRHQAIIYKLGIASKLDGVFYLGVTVKKSLKVFGNKVPIKYFKETSPELAAICGYCQKEPLAIFINDSLSAKNKASTIIHELGHSIIFSAGLDQVLSEEIQEIICEQFAKVISENYNLKK